MTSPLTNATATASIHALPSNSIWPTLVARLRGYLAPKAYNLSTLITRRTAPMDFASGALFTIGCTAIINYRNVLKTMKGPTNPLEFEDRDQWRSWLEVNHATKREAWLLIYKKKYQELGLALYEAVEEALCFGWIDGTLSPLDKRRYALRFSPRTKNSIWSMRNIQRVEKLMADGKMTDAGMLKVAEAKANGEWEAALRREQVDSLPQDLEKALRKREGGLSAYQALPASRKKLYIYWLQSAKREETKQRRIQKIVEEVLNQ